MPLPHCGFLHFFRNTSVELFLSVLNSVVFFHWSIVCQLVATTDLIELSIKIIVKGKMKSRQNNTVGLAVNKTYGLFSTVERTLIGMPSFVWMQLSFKRARQMCCFQAS